MTTLTARQRVLEAAVDCVASRGAGRTTVEEVARIAGVSRVTVYRHFKDRDALLDAAIAAKAEQFNTSITPVLRRVSSVSEGVITYLVRSVDAARRDPAIKGLLVGEDAERVAALFRRSPAVRESLTAALAPLLAQDPTAIEVDLVVEWVSLLQLALCTDAFNGGRTGAALTEFLQAFVAPALDPGARR
jgi:AcrR family transcriptional regulator